MGDLTRRDFLHATSVGVVGAAALPALAHTPQPTARAHSPQPTAVRSPSFELEELTLADIQGGYASGRWTAVQVTQLYLDRIAANDRQGPTLRSLLDINPDAVADATARDGERRTSGRPLGALHGIPVIVKDNCDSHDKMTTTAGSLA